VPQNDTALVEYRKRAREILDSEYRQIFAKKFATATREDTIFLLHDPRLTPISLLIETSAWESALCAVQRTDFRNFAHGRHVWLGHRPERSFILALTGTETLPAWITIRNAVTTKVRNEQLDFGNCGRFQNALGIIQGLCVVDALGRAVDVDPGRPGIAPFAAEIFESNSLLDIAARLSPPVRHKRAAVDLHDNPEHRDVDIAAAFHAFLERLRSARFSGLVLDYDGTIVPLSGRFDPPDTEIAIELRRLVDEGMRLAIATGRGGSAGEMLRKIFPAHQDQIFVSYYNGAFSQMLAVNIDESKPPSNPRLDRARTWLREFEGIQGPAIFKDSGVQLTIAVSNLANPGDFVQKFRQEFNKGEDLRLCQSSHTIDICLIESCKTSAARKLSLITNSPLEAILCIGDNGAFGGNDHALLTLPHGVSVGHVCDDPLTCFWFVAFRS